MSDVPSGYRIQNVMTAWHEARASLLENDPTLEHDEAALGELLGPAEGDANDILARVLRAKVHADNMASAADDQVKMILARKRRYQTREDALKALAVTIMGIMGRKKLELGDLTASVIAGRVGVHIPDPDKVDDKYCEIVVTKKPDKETIKAFLEAGETVAGAELKTGADYLMIRRS